VPPSAGLRFTKFCSSSHPGDNVASGYFQTFDGCIELCASLNFWSKGKGCKSVDYMVGGVFRTNFWAHSDVLESAVVIE